MKRILLSGLFVTLWACFVNAQPPQDNANSYGHKDSSLHRFHPNGNFHKPGGRDSSFRHFQANRFRPGGPGFKGNQFHQGAFAGRFNKGAFNKGMQQRRMGMMARVHLTPDQLKQSKSINEAYHQQVAELQKKDKISLGTYKSQLAALNKEHKAKLEAVLTEEQRNRIAQGKKQVQINAQVRSAANLERMKLTLGLSEDQVTQIKSNREDLHKKIQAIHENEALLPEEKKAQLKSLLEQQKDIVKSVLTPEQQSKADSLRKNFNFRGGNWNKNRPGVK